MKKVIYLIAIIAIITIKSIYAQTLTESYTFSLNDLQFSQTDSFDIVDIANCTYLSGDEFLGKPQIPVKYFNMLLPESASATSVTFTVNSQQFIGDSINLYPVQNPVVDDEIIEFVEPDSAIYNSNNPFPSDNIISYQNNGFRGYNYLSVKFSPVQYLPLSGQLYLYTNITITISYSVNQSVERFQSGVFNKIDELAYNQVESIVNNKTQITSFYSEATANLNTYKSSKGTASLVENYTNSTLPVTSLKQVDYVIITNNTDVDGNDVGDFVTLFQPFADYKTRTGTPTAIVTVDDINDYYTGVDIQEKIREFIKDASKNWGTDYVLLGGNTDIIPVRTMYGLITHGSGPSDLYYSAIWHPTQGYEDNWNGNGNNLFGESGTLEDCDYVPDLALGRAPIETVEELELFLMKNYRYYRCSLADVLPNPEYLGKHLNIGDFSFIVPWNTTQPDKTKLGIQVVDTIAETYSDEIEMYTMMEYLEGWNDPTHDNYDSTWVAAGAYDYANGYTSLSNVKNQLNNGYGVILHLDHGIRSGLGICRETGGGFFKSNDIKNITGQNGILLSGGCITNPIDYDDYFGKHWITEHEGGVAYIGSVRSIFSSQKMGWYSFFHQVYDLKNYELGFAKAYNILNNSQDNYRSAMYHLLGDPQLPIYTSEPVDLTVNCPSSIIAGNEEIEIVINGIPAGETATVCFYKEDDFYQKFERSNGRHTFSGENISSSGELFLTITGHNMTPYEKTIIVSPSEQALLNISNYKIIDENRNGKIEKGETIELQLELTNNGLNTAVDIHSQLSTIEDITIINNNSGFENISFGQSAYSINNFKFKINETYNTDNSLKITFFIREQTTIFREHLTLFVETPVFQLSNRTTFVNNVDVNAYSSGDEIELFVKFMDEEGITNKIFTGILETENSLGSVTISNSTQTFENLIGNNYENSTPFNLKLSNNFEGEIIDLKLTLIDEFNITYVFDFNLNDMIPLISDFYCESFQTATNLVWKKPAQDIYGYNIYRSNSATGGFYNTPQN